MNSKIHRRCPFCSAKAELVVEPDVSPGYHTLYWKYVRCTGCDIQTPRVAGRQDAIALWEVRDKVERAALVANMRLALDWGNT